MGSPIRQALLRETVLPLTVSLLVGWFALPHALGAQVSTDDSEVETAEDSGDSTWYELENVPGGGRIFGDFVVGPGKVELEIAPGESKTVLLSVTNRIGEPHVFNFDIEDATGSQDPAKTVELLGNERGPYTLRDYISLPDDSLTLNHNERARIPVTISIPPDAEPGGRYGSVLVNTVAVKRGTQEDDQFTSQSPIIARIGTLFFITIPGETERGGELINLSTIPNQQWFNQGPIRFGILFENTGSVHLAPYGTLSITNMYGQEVGYKELDPWFAMPDSLRFREVVWESDRLFGKYTATVEINRSYQNIIDTKSVTFWVVPWQTIAVTFVVIFVVVFLFRAFFRRFEFRRKQ